MAIIANTQTHKPAIIVEKLIKNIEFSSFIVLRFQKDYQCKSCTLTLEITRLRVSKADFDANAPPQAQPISIKRRLAIRVH